MKQMMIKKLLYIIMVLSISYTLPAIRYCCADVSIPPNAGTTSATFLKYGIGSRAVAMGGAFGGLADDITAMYWNPAGLAQLSNSELSVTHNESFQGINDDFAGYAFHYKKGVLGVAAYGLYTPTDLERRSGLNENDAYFPISSIEGYFGAYDIAGHVSYARYFKENLSLGASLKLIQETIDSYSAYGAAVDLGSFYKFKELPLSMGLSIENIGPPIKFISQAYSLPLNIRLGSAYKFNDKLTATFDLNQPNDNYLSFSAGAEYWPMSLFALRAGYVYNSDGLELGDLYGFSAGIGFNIKMQDMLLKIDYAFVPNNVLGDSQRMTIGMVFGNPNHVKAVALTEAQAQTLGAPIPAQTAIRATPLPKEPPIKPLLITSQYNMFSVKTNIKRKISGGHQMQFKLNGDIIGCDVSHIEGSFTTATKDFTMAIGEKTGKGNVYKHYIFQTSYSIPIYNASCAIRVPKNIVDPVITAEDGTDIETEKDYEDDQYVYFEMEMDIIKPFRVESKTAQTLQTGATVQQQALITPLNNLTTNQLTLNFSWPGAAASTEGAVNYILEVSTDSAFSVINYSSATILSNATLTLIQSSYTWRVNTLDKALNYTTSTANYFVTIDTTPPPAVSALSAPLNNLATNQMLLNFSWSGVTDSPAGIANYFVQVSSDPAFSVINYSSATPLTNATLALNPSSYTWRVNSMDNALNYTTATINYCITIDTSVPAALPALSVQQSGLINGKTNIAVAEFTGRNVSQSDALIVSDFLRTELVNLNVYNIVEKANMDKILAEASFQMTGCTTADCVVQLGKILNVREMVIGSLAKLTDTYYITVNIVDVETGKILASFDQDAPAEKDLKNACHLIAGKMSDYK